MGCDIHGVIEQRVAGVWTHDPKAYFPSDRSYSTFSLLAGVRNYDDYKPIADPRGLPKDIAAESLEIVESKYGDYHSHSYLSLREIFEYNYVQTTTVTGIVAFSTWAEYQRRKEVYKDFSTFRSLRFEPESYSRAVSGPKVRIVPEFELMSEILSFLPKPVYPTQNSLWHNEFLNHLYPGKNVYVQATWEKLYLDAIGSFLRELIPLIRLGLDDVRLVFSFDN